MHEILTHFKHYYTGRPIKCIQYYVSLLSALKTKFTFMNYNNFIEKCISVRNENGIKTNIFFPTFKVSVS